MAHKHSVYDTDSHFQINPITRKITNVSNSKTVLIQHDHNSERFTFELPRYVEGHDMSLCTKVQIHYLNVASNKSGQTAGLYEVEDLQSSPESEDVIICSWLISRNATQYAGSLNFLLSFICVTDEIDYTWNTEIYTGISVSEGINNGEIIVEDYADVLEQWENKLFETTSFGWTDFDYSLDNPNPDSDFNDFVGDDYITSPFPHAITIHCAGEVLGFTASTGDEYFKLKVNGEYVLDSARNNSVKTYTMLPTDMTEDIVVELLASTIHFSNMTKRIVRGLGDVGDIDTALDRILSIQNSLIGGETV